LPGFILFIDRAGIDLAIYRKGRIQSINEQDQDAQHGFPAKAEGVRA